MNSSVPQTIVRHFDGSEAMQRGKEKVASLTPFDGNFNIGGLEEVLEEVKLNYMS